jgi:hypothetical protein
MTQTPDRPEETADADDPGATAPGLPEDLTPDDPSTVPPDHDDLEEESDGVG